MDAVRLFSGNHFVKYGKLWSQSSQPIHLHVHSLDKPGALAPISYHGYENEVTGSSKSFETFFLKLFSVYRILKLR